MTILLILLTVFNALLLLYNLRIEWYIFRQNKLWQSMHEDNTSLVCFADCAYRSLDGDCTCRLKETVCQCLNFEPRGGNNHDENFVKEGQK